MRYIGNKTKILPEIERILADEGVGPVDDRDGSDRRRTFLDIFAGTASVARRAKALGFRVLANDRLHASYVLAKAALEVDEEPPDLAPRLAELRDRAPLAEGLVARAFSPLGPAGRRFFTPEHARRIDGALEQLVLWRRARAISPGAFQLLLAAVLSGADRVANISGTYGAFLKTWQANTAAAFRLDPPAIVPSDPAARPHRAYRADANRLVRLLPCDVLYIDPPYNRREYAANYHVLEAIAERRLVRDLAAFEATIYGVSGLRPYRRSAFSDRRRVFAAFRDLVLGSQAEHVVVSYNEEGLLTRDEIDSVLGELAGGRAGGGSGPGPVRFEEVSHKRFRSDRDGRQGRNGSAPRAYRSLAGRGRDEIREWLFFARRGSIRELRRACRTARGDTPLVPPGRLTRRPVTGIRIGTADDPRDHG